MKQRIIKRPGVGTFIVRIDHELVARVKRAKRMQAILAEDVRIAA